MKADMKVASDPQIVQVKDRFLYWPLILVIVWVTLSGFEFSELYGLLGWLWSASIAAMFCIASIFQRAWRRLLSTMILPLSVLVYLGLPGMVGNYVHLFVMYPVYRIEISQLPTDEPRFMVWDWGPGYRGDYGVVYDESDQITSDHPSGSWKERADRLGVHYGGEPPVFHHFYFVGLY
jgi:hypothetical protein